MSSTTITRGNSRETFYVAPVFAPVAVAAATTAAQTFPLPGAQPTDIISPIGVAGSQIAGIFLVEADCFVANFISIRFGNLTAAAVVPNTGAYVLEITRIEGVMPLTAV